MLKIKKEILFILAAISLFTIYYFGEWRLSLNLELLNQSKESIILLRRCLTETTKFKNALKRQKQGIVMIRDNKTKITNYNETLLNIPTHFNVGKLNLIFYNNAGY